MTTKQYEFLRASIAGIRKMKDTRFCENADEYERAAQKLEEIMKADDGVMAFEAIGQIRASVGMRNRVERINKLII